jgi:hypothetical protein
MYRYDIEGEDYTKGKVKQIGRTIAVIVDRDWVGSDVIVIKKGDIEKFEKIHD